MNARCDREPRAGRPMQQVLRWGGTIRCASPWQQQLHRIGPRDDPGLFVILALSLSLSLSPAHSYHGNYIFYPLSLSIISLKLFHREIIMGVVMCNCILFNLLSSVLLQLYLVSPRGEVPQKSFAESVRNLLFL